MIIINAEVLIYLCGWDYPVQRELSPSHIWQPESLEWKILNQIHHKREIYVPA